MRSSQTDLFSAEDESSAPSDLHLERSPLNRLQMADWPPSLEGLSPKWRDVLTAFWQTEVGHALDDKIRASLKAGRIIYPRTPFRAFSLTPFDHVRVVVLGQDPYHGPEQAQGLAFSVGAGQKIPPSLRNIFKEIHRDTGATVPVGPDAGSLVRWAQQGVLLLNTALTVEDSLPASHSKWGWEALTDKVIEALAADDSPRAFLLWGGHAQSKSALIDAFNLNGRHLVLKANHPSPLSAMRPPLPFIGCGHFGLLNQWWSAHHQNPMTW